jgi:hypothetical protein
VGSPGITPVVNIAILGSFFWFVLALLLICSAFSALFALLLSLFFETFVDSKGLLRFVPSNLTSFFNFLQVSKTFGVAF